MGKTKKITLVDRVVIIVQVYGAVCHLYMIIWDTNLAT